MKPYIQLSLGIGPTRNRRPTLRAELVFKHEGEEYENLITSSWKWDPDEKISKGVEIYKQIAKDLGCRCKMDDLVKACYKDELAGKDGYPTFYRVHFNRFIDATGKRRQEDQA